MYEIYRFMCDIFRTFVLGTCRKLKYSSVNQAHHACIPAYLHTYIQKHIRTFVAASPS